MSEQQPMETRREPMEPQPPQGIKYLLGRESWLAPRHQTPLRLHCEEWGNCGPMELDAEIKPNVVGLRVRGTDFPAPEWARGFYMEYPSRVYYWTDAKCHGDIPARTTPEGSTPNE